MRDFTMFVVLLVVACCSANAVSPEDGLASRFHAAAVLIDTQMTREALPGLQEWVHEDGDRFRPERDDDTLAEAIIFERDDKGRVKSSMHHSYRSTRKLPLARQHRST